MAKLNIAQFHKELAVTKRNLSGLAYGAALSKFKSAKRELIEEFESDQVSQDIKGGISDRSDTIDGKGSLYGFLGFEAGRNPVREVTNTLEKDIVLNPRPVIIDSPLMTEYRFNVTVPTANKLNEVSPLPWTNIGWVAAIENGIAGLRNYLVTLKSNRSRSGGGIQIKNQLRSTTYKKRPFYTKMLERFKAAIQ